MDLDTYQQALDTWRAEHGHPHGVVLDAAQYVAIDRHITQQVAWDKDALLDGVPIVIRGTNEACPVGWCDLRSLG